MLRFGLLSSVFDFLTFGVLFLILQASPEMFRSGWFVESVISAPLVVLVLRTRGPFWRSRSSMALTLATLTVVAAAAALPLTLRGRFFGFAPLPPVFLALIGLIVATYIGSAEVLKRAFHPKAST
jgi:Mg2+-importing ATPase